MNLLIGVYRAVLWCLPAALRRKHGEAMAEVFAAELESVDGSRALIGVAARGVMDVLMRGAYEAVRPKDVVVDHPHGGVTMAISTGQLVRRTWLPFVAVFVATTSLLVANYLFRRTTVDSYAELAVLSVPFTAAMTIPVAMFVAMFWVSRRLPTESPTPVLEWSLVRSVTIVSGAIAGVALILTTVVLPRANARLVEVQAGHQVAHLDRSMTMSELRVAARAAQDSLVTATANAARVLRVREANLEVEFHKKFAIAAAVLVLGLVGLVLGWQFPRAGVVASSVISVGVFGVYYLLLMGGESMADALVVAPSLAMWSANLLAMMMVALTMVVRRRRVI